MAQPGLVAGQELPVCGLGVVGAERIREEPPVHEAVQIVELGPPDRHRRGRLHQAQELAQAGHRHRGRGQQAPAQGHEPVPAQVPGDPVPLRRSNRCGAEYGDRPRAVPGAPDAGVDPAVGVLGLAHGQERQRVPASTADPLVGHPALRHQPEHRRAHQALAEPERDRQLEQAREPQRLGHRQHGVAEDGHQHRSGRDIGMLTPLPNRSSDIAAGRVSCEVGLRERAAHQIASGS